MPSDIDKMVENIKPQTGKLTLESLKKEVDNLSQIVKELLEKIKTRNF